MLFPHRLFNGKWAKRGAQMHLLGLAEHSLGRPATTSRRSRMSKPSLQAHRRPRGPSLAFAMHLAARHQRLDSRVWLDLDESLVRPKAFVLQQPMTRKFEIPHRNQRWRFLPTAGLPEDSSPALSYWLLGWQHVGWSPRPRKSLGDHRSGSLVDQTYMPSPSFPRISRHGDQDCRPRKLHGVYPH